LNPAKCHAATLQMHTEAAQRHYSAIRIMSIASRPPRVAFPCTGAGYLPGKAADPGRLAHNLVFLCELRITNCWSAGLKEERGVWPLAARKSDSLERSRPIGCPQMTWGRTLKKVLKSVKLPTDFVQWRTAAADRGQWGVICG